MSEQASNQPQHPTNVERYYHDDPEREWTRLVRDRVEYGVSLRALMEHLPRPPARVLDIGGGPGRYSIELARRGYDVTLADIAPAELAMAREKAEEEGVRLADVVRADARDLSQFADASFEAVLLMGPLYHLLGLADRQAAASEAVRVAKPGGVIFATNITRYAAVRFWAKNDPMQVFDRRDVFEHLLATGEGPAMFGFTDVYFMHPHELPALFDSLPVEHIATLGVEGIVSMIRDRINELQGDAWEYWLDLNYRLASDPATHAGAEHLMYIGRKI